MDMQQCKVHNILWDADDNQTDIDPKCPMCVLEAKYEALQVKLLISQSVVDEINTMVIERLAEIEGGR